jgi:hypothetical protein
MIPIFPLLRSLLLAGGLVVSLGMRAQDRLKPATRVYAFTQVNLVPAPGKLIPGATVLVRDGLIVEAGPGLRIPGDARVIRADSMYVYAGFIDGFSRAGIPRPKPEESPAGGPRAQAPRLPDPGNPPRDVAGIEPEKQAASLLDASDKSLEELRALGFTAAHVMPYGGMLPGTGTIILTAGEDADALIIRPSASLGSRFAGARRAYPSNVLGVMASWRQLYKEAEQALAHQRAYQQQPAGMARPAYDRSLEAFFPVIEKRYPAVFEAGSVLEIHRALALQKELGFLLVLAGLREGWELAGALKQANVPVFLSLKLPKADEKAKVDSSKAEQMALAQRKAEMQALYEGQAAAFEKAGIAFGFASAGAAEKDIRSNLMTMIERGLSPDAALAALTTQPARLLGLDASMGTVEKGKMANLLISDKPYFTKDAQVRYVMVGGELFEYEAKAKKAAPAAGQESADVAGTWSYTVSSPQGEVSGVLILKGQAGSYSGTISNEMSNGAREISNVEVSGKELSFEFALDMGGQSLSISVTVTVEGDAFEGTMSVANFGESPMEGRRSSKPD